MSTGSKRGPHSFQHGIVPLLVAGVYGGIAAATGNGSLVPVSVVVFVALYYSVAAGSAFERQSNASRIERIATRILGHTVLRAVAAIGVFALFLALFDASV